MSRIRVLVGTRKGAFICEADGARRDWKITGPHFAGWEIYHMKASPVQPERIYASMAVDRLDDCGIYFGTTGGQVDVSADAGDHWQAIAQNLPAVLSVEVQTLP